MVNPLFPEFLLSSPFAGPFALSLLQRFFSHDLLALAKRSGLFVRTPRKLNLPLFVQALLAMATSNSPSLPHLQHDLRLLGHSPISLQALWKRLLRPIVDFVAQLTLLVLRQRLNERFRDGLFASFPKVLLHDSTTIALPDAFAGLYPGSGNQKKHRSLSQLKLQCVLSLRTYSFQHLSVSGFNRNDQSASPDILPLAGPGDLVIRDLGYFAGHVFSALHHASVFFLSRLRANYSLFCPRSGLPLDLPALLKRHRRLDLPIHLGHERIPVRLLAVPVPPSVQAARRRHIYKDSRANPSRERLFFTAWTLLVTNVPSSTWSVQDALQAYRLRWSIEMVFKAWKSQLGLARLNTVSPALLHLSLGLRLLAGAIAVALWSDLERDVSDQDHASLLKVSGMLRTHGALLSAVFLQAASPDLLLDDLLRSLAFHQRRRDRVTLRSRCFRVPQPKPPRQPRQSSSGR